nr:unnamed protein product [Spirometra erinaceieuropaei]
MNNSVVVWTPTVTNAPGSASTTERTANSSTTGGFTTNRVHELLCAGDCALNANSERDMQRSIDVIGATCDNFGLIINNVNGAQLLVVDNFTYLGNTLSRTAKIDGEVTRRISQTS